MWTRVDVCGRSRNGAVRHNAAACNRGAGCDADFVIMTGSKGHDALERQSPRRFPPCRSRHRRPLTAAIIPAAILRHGGTATLSPPPANLRSHDPAGEGRSQKPEAFSLGPVRMAFIRTNLRKRTLERSRFFVRAELWFNQFSEENPKRNYTVNVTKAAGSRRWNMDIGSALSTFVLAFLLAGISVSPPREDQNAEWRINFTASAHAQTYANCEWPPLDEPDGDGDECV